MAVSRRDQYTQRRRDAAHNAQTGAELLDRMPPHSLSSERGLLSSILLDPTTCDDVATIVRPQDFYSEAHRTLFERIVEMHNEARSIDLTLVLERLKESGDLDRIGGEAFLAEVLHAEAVPAHAVSYAEIVRDKAHLRSLIEVGAEIIRDAYDSAIPPRELLGQSEQKIFAIHDGRSQDSVASIKQVLLDAFETIDARLRDGGATGIPSGFADLDKMLGGLHPSELIILAARPSMGKTALATNIADHVAVEEGQTTLIVSLEMAKLELAQRMVCARGHIDGRKFRNGFASGEDHEAFARASSQLSGAPLYIDDTPSRTMTEIAAVARRLKRRHNGLGLIVIDYLQLIQPDNSSDPRQEQVAKIARRLKGLARELEVPVLCLAQLNRMAEASKDNIPRLSHLRESGAIEQDADVVMFVHREEYYHPREVAEEKGLVGKAQIIISKQRNGPVGNVDLMWLSQFTKFVLLEKHEHDDYVEFEGADSGF